MGRSLSAARELFIGSKIGAAFRFNDAVIRNAVIRRKGPVTGNSKIYEEELRDQEKDREREQRREEESAERARRSAAADGGESAPGESAPGESASADTGVADEATEEGSE